MRTIKDIPNIRGKRILVRVDFNVPLEKGKVLEDSKILASLPTIEYLVDQGAKVILVTHLGRPGGKIVDSLKIDPVAKYLGKILKKNVRKLETGDWQMDGKEKSSLEQETAKIGAGEVVMLENIRFSPHEKGDQGILGQELSHLADGFVLDGFAVAHRGDASISGVAKYLPAYAGFLLEQEIDILTKLLKEAKKSFVVVIGGAKLETKIPVIKNLLPQVDKMLVGGAIFSTYLKGRGYEVGKSLVDDELQKDIVKYCKKRKIILPLDLIVGTEDGKNHRQVVVGKDKNICKKNEAIFDIGPATIQLFAQHIKKARTLVWNGAMGYFEQKPYDIGTLSVARLVASRSKGRAYGVIGGGETIQSMDIVEMAEYVDFVSTGGGAMLEFLAGKRLPGIEVVSE